MLVSQCQLWIARLTTSLAAVTSRKLVKLTEELQVKKQELSSQAKSSYLEEGSAPLEPIRTAEKGVVSELQARVEGLKENIVALASYKVCQSKCSYPTPFLLTDGFILFQVNEPATGKCEIALLKSLIPDAGN